MSHGMVQDSYVMIQNSSIRHLEWPSHSSPNANRISVVRRSTPKPFESSDRSHILTGIEFGVGVKRSQGRLVRTPLHQAARPTPRRHRSQDCEPLWVTLLGSLSLVLGFLACWLLL